jgi:hypothetical protein
VLGTVNRVRAEQTREEQHFGDQEQPDPELPGIELLLRSIEVVRQKRVRIVRVIVPGRFFMNLRAMRARRALTLDAPCFGSGFSHSRIQSKIRGSFGR